MAADKKDQSGASLSAAKQALIARRIAARARAASPELAPMPRVDRRGPMAASLPQESFWFLQQLDPLAPTFGLASLFRLSGRLDVGALSKATDALVARHEVLRTTFVPVDGKPMLRINPPRTGVLLVEDAVGTDDATLAARADAEARAPFDLQRGPLLRASLLRRSDTDHLLSITMHHAVGDDWSWGIIESELVLLYSSFARGAPNPLPPLQVQYADYAAWQRELLAGAHFDEQVRYWRSQLAGAPAAIELPLDHPRRAQQHRPSAAVDVSIPKHVTTALASAARARGATLNMALTAAFGAFLSRNTGQQDVVIGCPIGGRTRAEIERLVGLFVNNLAIRVSVAGDPTFVELLDRVAEVHFDAFAHADIPFHSIIEALAVARDSTRNPIYQVMFAFYTRRPPGVAVDGVSFARIQEGQKRSTVLDLTLMLADGPDGVQGVLEYDTTLFDASTAERMRNRWLAFLDDAALHPTRRISELALGDDDVRANAESAWNATDHDVQETRCVHELFEEHAQRMPDATAVELDGELLTYGDLDARANRLAHSLLRGGVKRGDVVAVCLDRSIELVVALYAVLKSGAAYSPLDPSHPPERLRLIAREVRAPVVLVSSSTAATFDGASLRLLLVDEAPANDLPSSTPHVALAGDDLAYVIHTSGSTGTPKGVMNVHAGLRNRLLWMQNEYRLTPDDAVMQKTPYTFDVSVWEFFWPLMFGARLVVARPEGHKDPAYLVQLIRERGVTTAHFVPSMLAVFLEQRDVSRCSSLRRVICSGEALARALQDRFFERLGAELHNLYGPTEASIDVSYWKCLREDPRAEVPIGRPIWNTRLHVVDDSARQCPTDVPGELWIAGVGLARGYANRPDLTAERFVPDPFASEPGARAYRTGDLARWRPDGTLAYLGRIDHQIKLRGFRIELGEIEQALGRHPGVRDVVVIAREDVPGDKRLVAYAIARDPAEPLTIDAMRDHLRAILPDYMIPSALVVLEVFPLTSSGKTDRAALVAPVERPTAAGEELPKNALEERLAKIWSNLLRLESVGVNQDFFALGGHSLLLTQLATRVEREFGVELSLRTLFESATVRGVAEAVAEQLAQASQSSSEMEGMLAEIEGLSPEEVEALLAEEESQ